VDVPPPTPVLTNAQIALEHLGSCRRPRLRCPEGLVHVEAVKARVNLGRTYLSFVVAARPLRGRIVLDQPLFPGGPAIGVPVSAEHRSRSSSWISGNRAAG
jgi:hypothetical protein